MKRNVLLRLPAVHMYFVLLDRKIALLLFTCSGTNVSDLVFHNIVVVENVMLSCTYILLFLLLNLKIETV